jgi:CDP-paratose 2-epimerase
MRAHYPQWDITITLEETIRQIVEAWTNRKVQQLAEDA